LYIYLTQIRNAEKNFPQAEFWAGKLPIHVDSMAFFLYADTVCQQCWMHCCVLCQ